MRHLHYIGIGGIGMSGLAAWCRALGMKVTGSDREQTQFTPSLDEAGIPYSVGQNGQYVKDADLVIYSAAIKKDNPDLPAFEEYDEFLAAIEGALV